MSNIALSSSPVALTPGEPAGIGPDICLQLAAARKLYNIVAIADPQMLAERAELLGLEVELLPYPGTAASRPGQLQVLPVPLARQAEPGRLDPANAEAVLTALTRGVDGCLAGEFAALVTAPMHKGIINEAGIPFTGHTEFLAARCGTEKVVMMLATSAGPGLRVALATTHLPLRQVSDAITTERLEWVLRILHHDLQRRFGLAQPQILVCGLNPHAGEDGHLGREEIEVITPLLNRLRAEGMALKGPLPADTLFTPPFLEQADAVLAMYHDQGLPVLKHMGFGHAVNITLGLPIIRTSVDHGTALDLAGTGRAETGSLEYAIEVANQMAKADEQIVVG